MNDIAKKKFEILNYTQSDEFNIDGLAEKLNELTRMCDDSSAFTLIEDEMPAAYQTGDWDGKRSDLLVLKFDDGKYETGRLYHCFMDGSEFNEWYSDDDLGWAAEKVVAWAKIPK